MSRLIKFRVWTFQYGYMVNPETYGYMSFALKMDGRLLHLSGPTWQETHDSDWIVEQFTGLLDKNGKEIYEGDIIRMGEPRYVDNVYIDNNVGVVQMFRTQWALHPVETLGKEHGGIIYFPFWDIPPVIGNVHENPELLK